MNRFASASLLALVLAPLPALLPVFSACTTSTADTAIPLPDGGSEGGVFVILDGGGTPATPPNGQALCPTGVCNYQTGAGCPAADPACIPSLNGTTVTPACEPGGAGTTGVSCTQVTDCAAGYFCSSDAQCHKLCCGYDWTGCDSASEHCLQQLSYAGPNGSVIATGAMLCYPVNTCDALMPSSCPTPGTTCQIADATGVTACLPEGSGGAGEPCPCKGGFTCLEPSPDAGPDAGGKACHRLCGAVAGGAPPYCQEHEGICVHYVNDPPGVGECVTNP